MYAMLSKRSPCLAVQPLLFYWLLVLTQPPFAVSHACRYTAKRAGTGAASTLMANEKLFLKREVRGVVLAHALRWLCLFVVLMRDWCYPAQPVDKLRMRIAKFKEVRCLAAG